MYRYNNKKYFSARFGNPKWGRIRIQSKIANPDPRKNILIRPDPDLQHLYLDPNMDLLIGVN
jgi:hypothetical protein